VPARYRRNTSLAAFCALVALSAAGCGGSSTPGVTKAQPSASAQSPSPSPAAPVDPASVHANELGQIPVLMYHQFLAKPRGVYDQTIAQFRAELASLYAHGYRTITAADLVAGHIDVPAGKKPMVLTFDDSTVSQYGELPDGSVDPKTAVGVLLDVAKKAGEEHPVATFYVNGDPFAGRPKYLAKLHEMGFEVAEHTLTHANLKQLDDAGVQAELAKGLKVITDAIPGVQVTTMALPFGVRPRNHAQREVQPDVHPAHPLGPADRRSGVHEHRLVASALCGQGDAVRQRRRPRAHLLPEGLSRQAGAPLREPRSPVLGIHTWSSVTSAAAA
jgi:hypothetical protein